MHNENGLKKNSLVCYCFGYTAEDIRQDLKRYGFSTILEQIKDAKKRGRCNCKVNHPQGR